MYILLAALLLPLTSGRLVATTPYQSCVRPVDVIFVLDGSDSIDDISMTRVKEFVIDFASAFMIDSNSSRFGAVMYSANVAGVVPLRHNVSLFNFNRSVQSLPHPKDGTNTDVGINKMRKMFAANDQFGVPMSGIVITDGRSKLQNRTVIESRLARTEGIQMFAIGIGFLIDKKELESIASIGNVMTVDSFVELQSLIGRLYPRVCPPLPTTTITTPPPPPPPPSTIPISLLVIRKSQVFTRTGQLPDGICDECVVANGVGYTSHPTDCSLYVQCFFIADTIKSLTRECPFGMFWDPIELTCKPAWQVQCKTDQCRNKTVGSYSHNKNCRYYWACEGGVAIAKCCPQGQAYATGRGCVRDTSCQERCTFHEEIKVPCNKRPYQRDVTIYQEYVVGQGWINRLCPPGTTYLHQTCSCGQFGENNKQSTCTPEILMSFNGESAKDESENRNKIGNEGVVIDRGVALFKGRNRLMLWRFSNSHIGNFLFIRFRFKLKSISHLKKQALVTNGGCIEKPSVFIVANTLTNQLEMGADTPLGLTRVSVRFEPTKWNEVTYLFDSGHLRASVGQLAASGRIVGETIINKHCAMQIGAGLNYGNFQGSMDYISIFLCHP